MSETSTINEQANQVRNETISILDALTGRAGEFELPKPPEALERYHQRLVQNTYKVLVAGEAKRGKSSFVNALIGQDVLPTNVRVATSQVFDVRLASREAYRLRFEDNSVRDISREDLPRYGSQVLEDAGERPELDQVIRWIEVDTPTISFLPRGVSLLDTPGLGALYAAHAEITQRFVEKADAVIFVLDSEKPIVQSEIEFIETILKETPDIFFVQTKIDLYDEDAWRDTLKRNREILEQKLGDKLTDAKILPISSELLLKAAQSEETRELYETESLHREMQTALRAFLFRVAGWRRSAEAILVADGYHGSSHTTLSGRLANLTEDEAKRAEIRRRASERKEQFEREWGQEGQKRRELQDEIKRRINLSRRRFDEALRVEGAVGQAVDNKIEELQSLQEARAFNEAMGEEVKAAAGEQWRLRCKEAEAGSMELLVPFLEASEVVMSAPQSTATPAVTAQSTAVVELERTVFEGSVFDKLAHAREQALAGVGLGGTSGAIVGLFATPILEPVFIVVGAVIGGLWGLRSGWQEAELTELRGAKATLRQNLANSIEPVRQLFFSEPDTSFRSSPVNEYFDGLDRATSEQIQTIVKQKLEEAEAEHARLGRSIANVSERLNEMKQPRAALHQRQDVPL
jgi:GTPase SAR1 family protein